MPYYDGISKGYDELHEEEQLKKLRAIKDNFKASKNAKMLDLGCGSGLSSDFECIVTGIDPSIGLLKINRHKRKILGIAESLPFKGNVFDYIISVTAIHNFRNIKKSLKEIKRVGKNDFVFSVLRKSRRFDFVRRELAKNFMIIKAVKEQQDIIFFCKKP